MTFSNAMLYSLLGIGVVFFALIFLMVIIKLMTAIGEKAEHGDGSSVSLSKESPAENAGQGATSAVKADGPKAPGSAGELKLYNTPPRTAAMLMAIVADEMKAPINELRFISIKEVGENK